MPNTLRLGTRRSPLALAQSQWFADALVSIHPHLKVELVPVVTSGDRYFGPLHAAGGKGLFTAELEAALRDGSVDFAVHSAKDLPAEMADDLAIAAVPAREDPRDALVSPGGGEAASLPRGAVVGTSSLRRAAQLLAARNDIKIIPFRGNVETRIRKVLDERAADATLLAIAGLKRGGFLKEFAPHVRPLDVEIMVPAAGQGTLAIQAMRDNQHVAQVLASMEHADSRAALEAERAIVRTIGADCLSSLAVHVCRAGDGAWQGLGFASRPDYTGAVRCQSKGATAQQAGDNLLAELLRSGADKLVKPQ